MKTGLATSAILHAALIGFGLVTLSAPPPLEVADVEALPVDIIPVESITRMQEGDKEATLGERPAPTPTEKPALPVENAERVGENEIEQDTPPTPDPGPRPVETAAAPPPAPAPEPAPSPDTEPAPRPETQAEPTPAAATELTRDSQQRQEVAPDPVEETSVAENPEAESVPLPETAPSPQARPQPPQAQTAKAPERRQNEQPVRREAQARPTEEADFDADEIAALLDRQKASGGGAARSTQEAALGGDRNDPGIKLSQSEMDALRGQIQRCWNVPAGALDAENLRVSIRFSLDRAGSISGMPEIISGGGSAGVERVAAESARRAVLQCAPYDLPAEKYDAWAEVIVNFDPSEMF